MDSIFDHKTGPVTFAHDLNWLGNRVGAFSPWAMNCSCSQQGLETCSHLSTAIQEKFGVSVSNDWKHWNGGAFLFSPESTAFLDTWHSFTMEIFRDPAWKTRDQGTLIATVWTHGLQHQAALPPRYNFMIDEQNQDLRFDREKGFSLHASIPCIRPVFLHLYHAELDRPGWTLEQDLVEAFAARCMETAAREPEKLMGGPALASVGHQLRRRLPAPSPEPNRPLVFKVVLAVPHVAFRVGPLVRTLAQGLRKRGVALHVLFTEEIEESDSDGTSSFVAIPDVPSEVLPVASGASWGERWGCLVRYLEEASPCIYVPAGDWRHSTVSSQLSNRVGIVGLVQEDPRGYDELERLGRYWNGAIAASAIAAAHVRHLQPALAHRLVNFSAGWRERDHFETDLVAACEALFEAVLQEAAHGTPLRPKGLLRTPPYQAGGLPVLPIHYVRGIKGFGVLPSYRQDYEDYRLAVGQPRTAALAEWHPDLVEAYPVVLGTSGKQDAANTQFVEEMVRGLDGIDRSFSLVSASGVPAPILHFVRNVTALVTRKQQADASALNLVSYLEERAPCLYLPSQEPLHQAVCPQLSDRVGIIGRVDELDPQSLQRAAHMARHWNAVVAGNEVIATELQGLNPALTPRLVTIPLPVSLPARLTDQPLAWNEPLRVVSWASTESPASNKLLARIATFAQQGGAPIEWLPRSDQQDSVLFDRADVLLVLSTSAADAGCLGEAMRRGCIPVLASDKGLSPELLKDGENSFLVANGDAHALAARLVALQGNAALRRVMAAKAYTSTHATAEVFLTSYVDLFERVLREMEFGAFCRPVLPKAPRPGRRHYDAARKRFRSKGHYAQ